MSITTHEASAADLEARRERILLTLQLTMKELDDRKDAGTLTAEEWAAWDELDGIKFLLS